MIPSIENKTFNTEYTKSLIISALLTTRRFYCVLPSRLEALVSNENIDFTISGDLPASSFLFCTAKGIFIYSTDSGRVAKILNGKYYRLVEYEKYFGETQANILGSTEKTPCFVSNSLFVCISKY